MSLSGFLIMRRVISNPRGVKVIDLPVVYKGDVKPVEKQFFRGVANQIWAAESDVGFFEGFSHRRKLHKQASQHSLELRELKHNYQLEVRKQEQQYTLELVGQHRRYHLAKMKALEEFSLRRLQTQLQSELTLFIRKKMIGMVQELQKFAAEVGSNIMQTTDYAEQLLDKLADDSSSNKANRRKAFLDDLETEALDAVKEMASPRGQVSVLEQYLLPDS